MLDLPVLCRNGQPLSFVLATERTYSACGNTIFFTLQPILPCTVATTLLLEAMAAPKHWHRHLVSSAFLDAHHSQVELAKERQEDLKTKQFSTIFYGGPGKWSCPELPDRTAPPLLPPALLANFLSCGHINGADTAWKALSSCPG
jgi:hypothetical protein